MTQPWQKLWLRWFVVMATTAVVLWLLPPFRVVPLSGARQQAAAAVFDAEAFVEPFWRDTLQKSDLPALDATRLVRLLRANPEAAAELGHRLGFSRTLSFFVSGTGRVAAITPEAVSIVLEGESDEVGVVIETGPIFGNSIRDGWGLFDVNLFPNSRDFNAISAVLNRRVEEEILPVLQAQARVGVQVRFAGGVDVEDASHALPLRVVPVRVEFP
jgi:predicted lipoprotein